jgi:hypothetical protein
VNEPRESKPRPAAQIAAEVELAQLERAEITAARKALTLARERAEAELNGSINTALVRSNFERDRQREYVNDMIGELHTLFTAQRTWALNPLFTNDMGPAERDEAQNEAARRTAEVHQRYDAALAPIRDDHEHVMAEIYGEYDRATATAYARHTDTVGTAHRAYEQAVYQAGRGWHDRGRHDYCDPLKCMEETASAMRAAARLEPL